MLTEKLHDAQADFTNSTDLGALIDQSEQWPEKINEIVIGFLVTGMIFGGLFAIEDGWKGFCLGMFFPALGIATSVVQRFTGKATERTFRVHEHGLCLLEDAIPTKIHYHELDEFRFKKTMVCNELDWLQIHFELEVKSFGSGESKTTNWSEVIARGAKNSIDFDALNLRISETIADNMAATLEVDREVPWGNSNLICHNGIEARVKTGFLSSEMRFLPWAELEEMKFCEGKLLLWFESATVEIHHSEPNLFAGYILVERLVNSIYENWNVNQQTEEEMVIAMSDRNVYYTHGGV